jgi:phosphotransferase system IIB component
VGEADLKALGAKGLTTRLNLQVGDNNLIREADLKARGARGADQAGTVLFACGGQGSRDGRLA